MALGILMLFILSPHLPLVLGLIFLGGLWFGQKMMFGPQPRMVYQYAFSVALALIAGALSTQDLGYDRFHQDHPDVDRRVHGLHRCPA